MTDAPTPPPPPRRTGLVCPACREPVAVIEHVIGAQAITCVCPACGHRWPGSGPATRPQ